MNTQTIGRNLLIYAELAKVLNRFNEEQIPVIVLKGAAFAETVYENIGERTMDDVDLLVKPRDIERTKNLMFELGYQQYPDGDWVFAKSDSFFPIEITDNIFYLRNKVIPYSDKSCQQFTIWQSAQKTKIAGVETLILSPEDSLIYVAVHGIIHHGLTKPIWVNDIIQIIKKYADRINWIIFLDKVTRYHLWVPVYYSFFTVTEINNLVPGFVISAINKHKPDVIEQKLYQWIINKSDPYPYNYLLRLFTIYGIINKLKFVWQFLVPSKEFVVRRYGVDKNTGFWKLILLRQRELVSQLISLNQRIINTTTEARNSDMMMK